MHKKQQSIFKNRQGGAKTCTVNSSAFLKRLYIEKRYEEIFIQFKKSKQTSKWQKQLLVILQIDISAVAR